MEGIQHKTILANGLNIHIAQKGEGPLVLFIHGFPELWYSWRHQILFLADHGYRAVAPDLRGYGETTGAPLNDPTKFSIHHLVGDMIGVINALTEEGEKVFVVGHDWGAIIAWHLCMFRPDRVRGLVNMSVPFLPWNPNGDMATLLTRAYGEDHYMNRFQEPGKIEAKLGKMSAEAIMKKFFAYRDHDRIYAPKGKGFGYAPGDTPVTLPPWLSEDDLRYFANHLEKNSITGGVNYYRALRLSWELTAAWQGAKVMVPTKFLIGDLDLTYHMSIFKDYVVGDGFKKDVPLLEEVVVMEGVAHFLNQEKPDQVNRHIIDFLHKF